MLILSHTRPQLSRPHSVASGISITEEGLALVGVNDGGVMKARPSTGSGTTEKFLGVAASHTMIPSVLPSITNVQAVGTTLTLPFQPITGQLRLESPSGTAFTIVTGSPNASEAQYSGTGLTVTLNAADADKVFVVSLNYAPTVAQAIAHSGEGMPGQLARQTIQGRVGCIQTGIVATTCFSLTNPFTAGLSVTLAPNGLFNGNAGSGTPLPNVLVEAVPSVGSPYLILNLLP